MADDSASSKGVSRSPSTGTTTGTTTTQSSNIGRDGGGGGSGSGSGSGSGGSTVKTGATAAKSSTTQASNAAKKNDSKPAGAKPTGSGDIGSKGGGASTQKPGSGGIVGAGPVSAGKNNFAKAQNAYNSAQTTKNISSAPKNPMAGQDKAKSGAGQGFINKQTQDLKKQYSEYRSPQGITTIKTPQAPTAGRGITDPRKPAAPQQQRPQGLYGPYDPNKSFGQEWADKTITGRGIKKAADATSGLYKADLSKTFGENWADSTLTGRAVRGIIGTPQKPGTGPGGGALQAPNRTAPSMGRVSPTVQAGTSWTNPAGVPESVKKALADRGFAPDGTRLPTQAIAQDPALRGLNEEAKKNYPTVQSGPYVSRVYSDPDLAPKPAAPPKVQRADTYNPLSSIETPNKKVANQYAQYQQAATPNPNSLVGQQDPRVAEAQRQLMAARNRDALAGLVESITGSPSVPAPMNMRPGFQADRPANVPAVPQGGPSWGQVIGDAAGWVGDQAAQVARGWGWAANQVAGALSPVADAVGSAINYAADIGIPAGAPVSGPEGITRAPGLPPSGADFLGRSDINPMAAQGTSYASPMAARDANTRKLAAATAANNPPAMPAATGEASIQPSVPQRAPGISPPRPQARPDDFKDAYDTGSVDDSPLTYQGQGQGDHPTSEDIAGFGDDEDTRSVAPAGAQNSYKVQRGDTLAKIAAKNGTTVKAIAEANGITNVNKIRPGQTLNIPTDASISPMSDPIRQFNAMQGGLGIVPYNPIDGAPAVRAMGTRPGDTTAQRDYAYGGGPTQQSAPTSDEDDPTEADVDSGDEPIAPSQEGENVPPSQLERYPQDAEEFINRLEYDRDRAREAWRETPSRIAQAIRDGDFRSFQYRGDQGQGGRNWERTQNQSDFQAPPQRGPTDLQRVVSQLIDLIEQQQQSGILSGPSQAELVNRTFR